jgi:hypothetical protein
MSLTSCLRLTPMRGVKCGKYQFIALVGSVGVGLECFLFRLTQLPRRLVHTPGERPGPGRGRGQTTCKSGPKILKNPFRNADHFHISLLSFEHEAPTWLAYGSKRTSIRGLAFVPCLYYFSASLTQQLNGLPPGAIPQTP